MTGRRERRGRPSSGSGLCQFRERGKRSLAKMRRLQNQCSQPDWATDFHHDEVLSTGCSTTFSRLLSLYLSLPLSLSLSIFLSLVLFHSPSLLIPLALLIHLSEHGLSITRISRAGPDDREVANGELRSPHCIASACIGIFRRISLPAAGMS